MSIPPGFSRYNGHPDYVLSDDQWHLVESALEMIFFDATLSSFLSSISQIQFRRQPHDPDVVGWTPGLIGIGDLAYSSSTVDGIDGTDFEQSSARALFHELVHEKFGNSSSNAYDVFADEERAVFLENALFRPAFGGG